MSIERRLDGLEKAAAAQTGGMEAESLRRYRQELLAHPELLELLRAANAGDVAAGEHFEARVKALGLALPADPKLTPVDIATLYHRRAVETGNKASAEFWADRLTALGAEV